jgi:hypothetical protein
MLLDFLNCGSDIEQAFAIEKPSGNLKYLGTDNDLGLFSTAISFIGNNVYAYGAECDFFDHEPEEIVSVFERQTDGRLISINANTPPPTSPNPSDSYCPYLTAAVDLDECLRLRVLGLGQLLDGAVILLDLHGHVTDLME